MPLYNYECECGVQKTEWHKIDERHNGPECCGVKMLLKLMPTMVQADISPYRTVAADKETGKRLNIGSRKEHKEFLRRNGYEELGNEKPKSLAKLEN